MSALMNKKMMGVAACIVDTLPEIFPERLLDFAFSGFITIDDFVLYVMFECMKHAYDEKGEKHSIRHFLQKYGMTEDDVRMKYSRLQNYVMKYRQIEYDRRVKDVDPDDERALKHLAELLPPDMSTVEGKLEGHKLSEMNFYEITTISDLEFCKAFTEKRLMNTKSVDNNTFVEYCQHFDNVIINLHGRYARSDEETVFSTIAAFTLEWKYAYDFIYHVADAMCRHGVKEIPDEKHRLVALCADVSSQSMLGYTFSCHSRLATVRKEFIDLIIEEPVGSERYAMEEQRLLEVLGLISQVAENFTIDGIRIKDWFVQNTDMEDWASLCMEYDYFAYVTGFDKDWEKNRNKKIRYMREAFSLITYPK